jgi:CubicO group peptidase (beta-lactamase class C family)
VHNHSPAGHPPDRHPSHDAAQICERRAPGLESDLHLDWQGAGKPLMRRAFEGLGRFSVRARALLVCGCLLAGAAHADQIDEYVAKQMLRQQIPGLSLAVVRNGRILKLQGYGFADLELKVPVTPETVFEIGSITKQFVAAAIMTLVEQGKINLNDPAAKVLPDLPAAWREVTIQQLLTHTSGIPDFEEILGYGAYRTPTTAQQVIAVAAAKPMDFPPGTGWHYSNTGYYVLGLIIEKVSGEPYVTVIEKRILRPAGMTRTRSSTPAEIIPGRASGYAVEGGRIENRDPVQPTAVGAAGDLVSTTGDLTKWNAALDAQSVLAHESYARMWADQPLADGTLSGYGFGWFVSPVRGHRVQEHSGGTAGFSSDILRLPDDRVAVIVLTNSYSANPVGMAGHIARLLVPDLVYAKIPDENPVITKRVFDYYAHRLDPEVYGKVLAPELLEKVRPRWSKGHEFYRSLGPPLGIELVERDSDDAANSHRYRVRYAETALIVVATIDGSGRIADLAGAEE